MRSDRLWPVLVGTGLFLGFVGGLEWLGSHHEARYEVIMLANQPEASTDGSGGIEGGWETLASGPEQERARRPSRAHPTKTTRSTTSPAFIPIRAIAHRRRQHSQTWVQDSPGACM